MPKIRGHLDRHGFTDMAIRPLNGYAWAKTSVRADVVQAVLGVYRDHGIEPLIMPHTGGSAPMYLYTHVEMLYSYATASSVGRSR